MGSSRYFARYKAKLIPLIGPEAAAAVVSYYKWTLAGIAFVALGFLDGVAGLATSTFGLLAFVTAFGLAIFCAIRSVWWTSRGGKLVSAYLTEEWGRPVRIAAVKVSLRWWRWRVDQERQRLRQEATPQFK
jgi:hypothetical protein